MYGKDLPFQISNQNLCDGALGLLVDPASRLLLTNTKRNDDFTEYVGIDSNGLFSRGHAPKKNRLLSIRPKNSKSEGEK